MRRLQASRVSAIQRASVMKRTGSAVVSAAVMRSGRLGS